MKDQPTPTPRSHVFIIAVFMVLSLEFLMDVQQRNNLLWLRCAQSVCIFFWLYHCRQLQWFGLELPQKKALSVFITYAFICGVIGLGCVLLWPKLSNELPFFAQGILGLSLFILVGPIFEELFFRALLYRFLQTVMPTAMAIFLSASLFALMHGTWLSPQFIGGLIFALAYEQSKNIWVAVGLHAGANASIAILSLR
ncbi:MAG: type II CAAX endopeptidase family protein [Mariprofundaceae bacterium]|nr:type II CAAX endopeptidase family protein [Mariprofundaceae bacterium]